MAEESRRIARRAGIVAAGTLSSRVLGLLRDVVIAASFAAGSVDAYVVAFTIPNTLRHLLGEGALTSAFVPVFAESLEKEGRDASRIFLRRVLGALAVVLGLVSLAGVVFAPQIVLLFASGYREIPGKLELTVRLTRWMFPYIACMGLAALAMGVLNTLRRFFAPAFTPILLNVALLVAAVWLAPWLAARGANPIFALALGVAAGGILQVVFQLPALRREGMLAAPAIDLGDPRVRKVGKLMVPGLFGLAVYQIDIMLSRTFLSGLPEGSNTYFYLAQRIAELPQGIFTMALATAALPSLAGMAARRDWAEVRGTYGDALRLSLFFALPSAAACVALAHPISAVLFQHGTFSARQASEVARALVFQGAGIVAVAGVRQTVPVFYALQDTATPRTLAALNLVVFVAGCLLLRGPLLHAGVSLSITLAAFVQLVALLVMLRRKVGRLGLRRVGASGLRIALASFAFAGVARAVTGLADFRLGGTWANAGILAGALAVGLLAFLAVARILGSPELGEIVRAISRKGTPNA